MMPYPGGGQGQGGGLRQDVDPGPYQTSPGA